VHRVLEETVNTPDGKLKTGFGRTRLRGFLGGGSLASLATFAAFSTFA